ncbi:unnamed protein product, partial [Ixodes persulcatus]
DSGGTSDQNANNRRRPAAFSRNAALSARLQAPLGSKDCHARTGHQLRLVGDSHGAPKHVPRALLVCGQCPSIHSTRRRDSSRAGESPQRLRASARWSRVVRRAFLGRRHKHRHQLKEH